MSAAPDAHVVLRARGLLESADLAFRFVVVNAKLFAWLSACVVLPGLLGSLALRYWLDADALTTWTASLALALVLEGPFTALLGQQALRGDARVRDALRAFARRVVPFGLVLVAVAVLQGVALMLMAVPWVFAALATVFVPEVVLLEGAGMVGAFKRASRITAGYTGRAFGLVLLLILGRLAAVVVTDAALRPTLGVLLDVRIPVESLWRNGVSPYALLGLWISVPFCAAVRYFEYIDLRTLREGWDLQRRFQLLAASLGGAGGR